MYKFASALILNSVLASSALAADFIGASHAPGTVVTDYSGAGLISFDLDLANFQPVVLDYEISADDNGSPISFNAMVRNYAGQGIENLYLTLSMSSFSGVGTVTRQFGNASGTLLGGGKIAKISFNLPEYIDFAIGSPLGMPGEIDWLINSTELRSGDILSIAVAVPEPQTYALLLAGLGLLGFAARRRARA